MPIETSQQLMQFIWFQFQGLFTPSVAKILTSFCIATSTFLFGNTYDEALIAIVMLMIFDFIFGLSASKYEGTPITSRRGMHGIIKGLVYFSAIASAHFVDHTIPFELVQSTMMGFVAVNEFISILENIGRLGYETPKKLLNQLREKYK